MRRSLLDILVCPVCKEKLELKVEAEEGGEIMAGSLTCTKCGTVYPVRDGIPEMLPPEKTVD